MCTHLIIWLPNTCQVMELKGGTEEFIIIEGHVNMPYSVMNKIDRNSVTTSKLE